MKFAKTMRGRLKTRSGGTSPPDGGWLHSALRPNSAGQFIDEIAALNLAAIWRGVNVKAGDLAKLPLNVCDRLENGGKRPDFASPIYELLSYPNDYRTGRKQRHAAACHLILWGNSYQEVIRDHETGDPVRLELLDPRLVLPRRDDAGRLVYWLKGSESPWSGRKNLLPENVIHFSGLSLDGDRGLSPVRMTSDPLATATALDRYAGSLWGNGAIPNGVIECPPGWPDDARANFRTAWNEEYQGVRNGNKIAILEEGAKFVATAFDPEKLQMLSSREFSVVEIARIVGIPPHKLFDMSHDIQRSLEETNLDYYETEIDPICQGMADEYALKLLTVADRKRSFVAFDTTRLMRGKALERAQTNLIKMQNGVITANEWRAEDGANPFDEDIRIMPLNMQVIEGKTDADTDPEDEAPADPEPLPTSDRTRKVRDTQSIRADIIKVAGTIKHGPDYGFAFHNEDESSVHWTMGDSDNPRDGHDSSKDIEDKFGAIDGIESVRVESEWSPKKEDGWAKVYPVDEEEERARVEEIIRSIEGEAHE